MWTPTKSRRAVRTLARFGRRHTRWLLYGVLASLGVVLFRLALPWPLRGVVEVVFPKAAGSEKLLVDYLPGGGDPVLWLGGFYLVFAVASGLFELIQRTNLMRFAAHTVHDLRAEAVRGVSREAVRDRRATGDLIARIIGDSARIKAGMAGILVHVLQNGMIFIGVCAVLLWISPQLGLISLAAGLVALGIGLRTSLPVAETAGKQRRKEGDYASAIQWGLEDGDLGDLEKINASSARKEVRTTRLIGLSSLAVHVVLAVAIAFALWIGADQVRSGRISPGELFLFIAYALTVHRRMVQVGRQAARSGKVLACTNRIGALLDAPPEAADQPAPTTPAPVPLASTLRLSEVKLTSGRHEHRRTRLHRSDLEITTGRRVAVLGPVGCGKSSLLQVLAGIEPPDKGTVLWDSEDLSDGDGLLAARVDYLPQEPEFAATPLWKLLGLAASDALAPQQKETLQRIGAWRVIRSLPRKLEESVTSRSLSPTEARLLALAGILLSGQRRVWVLDAPLDGRGRRQAQRALDEIIERTGDRTLVVALSQSIGLDRFDRVLALREGRVRFDGTPAQWKTRRADPAPPTPGGGPLPAGGTTPCKR